MTEALPRALAMGGLSHRLDRRMAALRREIDALSESVGEARREITSLKPASLACHDLPAAAGRLDAVVRSSEAAAQRIMDGAEALLNLSTELGDAPGARIADIAVSILEAAAFQDITGQHVARVLIVLRTLEARLARLAALVGDSDEDGVIVCGMANPDVVDGPCWSGEGNDQAAVDRLLAGAD